MNINKCPSTLLDQTTSPYLAIVFHASVADGNTTIAGATRHDIVNDSIQTGQFVSTSQVKSIMDDQCSQDTPLSIIPANVLVDNASNLSWYKKAVKTPMWYKTSGNNPESFNVQWCNLLFVVNKATSSLYVYALGSANRPNLNSKVYNAPLMNIYKNGSVCQGTALLPKNISTDSIEAIEDTIFKSNFTHVNHTTTMNRVNTTTPDLLKFWRKLSKDNTRVKVSDLKYINTLGDLFIDNKSNFGA